MASHSNDTWLVDDARLGAVVLRVAWRGDIARIEREMLVASRMPATLGYPRVQGGGHGIVRDQPIAYSVTRRLRSASRPRSVLGDAVFVGRLLADRVTVG